MSEPYPPYRGGPWRPAPATFPISADVWNPHAEGGTVDRFGFELTGGEGGPPDRLLQAGAELVARYLYDDFDWSTVRDHAPYDARPIRVWVERSQMAREMVLDLGPRPEQQRRT
jgi:hypothetical protein